MANEEDFQLRIHQLEKEVARLHSQIKKQRYGLVWLDVPEAFDVESENKIPILEEVKEKAIRSDDGKPTHILIEGDNYHALSCLNYTHRGKIDVIYIDPPYNTGSDGFTYKDKRILTEFPDGTPVPKEHPLRHSYWLSFMSKRLELAKNLLSDKGVIFISIDDNEQANLKLLCDKVFGEDNFTNQFIWKRNSSGKTEVDKFTVNTEYVILYKKNNQCILNNAYKPLSNNSLKLYKFNDGDGRGKYQTVSLQKPKDPGPETSYDYIDNSGKIWKCPPKGWRMVYSKIKDLENDNRLILTGSTLRVKDYWNERKSEGKRLDTMWNDLPENTAGTSQLNDLFMGDIVFYNPKPIELINRCLQIGYSNSIILDFFAGSGTTMHAVMKLNEEDGGKRQCILVQQKEGDNNICENITYERNRRVMQGYTNAKGEQVAGLGNSMKYYKTAFVGKNASNNATDTDRVELSLKAGYLLALGENTLEEIITHKSYQIFSDEKGHFTAVYFTGNLNDFPEFVEEIEKFQTDKSVQIVVYIFCWGSVDIYENEFDNLNGITLKPIPQPILDIYKSINA